MKIINRVKKYREFKEILDLKKFIRNDIFIVYFRENDFGHARVGILVSKKNGNAVTRVKIKRQIRAIIDDTLEYEKVSKDLIVVISKRYSIDDFQSNKAKLTEIIESIKEK